MVIFLPEKTRFRWDNELEVLAIKICKLGERYQLVKYCKNVKGDDEVENDLTKAYME